MMYLLDSNILIGYLNGNKREVDFIVSARANSDHFFFSTITKIEVLSLSSLGEEEVGKIKDFLGIFNESYMDDEVILLSAELRRNLRLSLGDAVIVATAIIQKLTLVTNDKALYKKVRTLVPVIIP